jgi:hypothetical protein
MRSSAKASYAALADNSGNPNAAAQSAQFFERIHCFFRYRPRVIAAADTFANRPEPVDSQKLFDLSISQRKVF